MEIISNIFINSFEVPSFTVVVEQLQLIQIFKMGIFGSWPKTNLMGEFLITLWHYTNQCCCILHMNISYKMFIMYPHMHKIIIIYLWFHQYYQLISQTSGCGSMTRIHQTFLSMHMVDDQSTSGWSSPQIAPCINRIQIYLTGASII